MLQAPDPAPTKRLSRSTARDPRALSTLQSTDRPTSRLRSPHTWVSTTYFAEGFPYGVVHQMAEVLFRELGASLQVIGLTSLLHLPYNLKFLWAPLVDSYGTKRSWLVLTEVALALVLVALAFVSTVGSVVGAASGAFALLAFASATHDIAIDGYYLEALDQKGQSRFVGYRAMAYKIATMAVAGPLLVVAGRAGWLVGFLMAAGIMGLLLGYHSAFLPRVETARRPLGALVAALGRPRWLLAATLLAVFVAGLRHVRLDPWNVPLAGLGGVREVSAAGSAAVALLCAHVVVLLLLPRIKRRLSRKDSLYARAFVDFLDQEHVGRILGLVLFFRVGESFLLKMRYPFLKEAGMTLEQYGWASGTLGAAASFAATLLGGWLISRHGLRRWIWPMVIAQNGLNLLYVVVSLAGQHATLPWLVAVITIESFGAGLGTAVFMVYIMRCCRQQFKAAHMAILTALMSLSFTVAGVTSGFLAASMGYTLYFALSFVASLPAMALIPFVPHVDEPQSRPSNA